AAASRARDSRADAPADDPAPTGPVPAGALKDALLAEIRKAKAVFYNTVVAQAQKIDVGPDQITFTFTTVHKVLRSRFEQNRPWLETLVAGLAGRPLPVRSIEVAPDAPAAAGEAAAPDPAEVHKQELKAQAMAEPAVQALLDVFPSEIRDVEEM
ncbi:MAG: hypothetical protein KGN76_11735, partial [Acidobacteriota bacterium]|nr:hypothetical protein [Acidobacteriota bacterium]